MVAGVPQSKLSRSLVKRIVPFSPQSSSASRLTAGLDGEHQQYLGLGRQDRLDLRAVNVPRSQVGPGIPAPIRQVKP
jgi:hypothetical protein